MADKQSEIVDEIKGLLKQIIYWNLEIKKNKKINDRVLRGRSSSISNFFEDKFATMLGNILPSNYNIFVDYPISYKISQGDRSKTSYPDIMIVKDYNTESNVSNGLLAAIIELKIDLGWLNEDLFKTKLEQFNTLRSVNKVSFNLDVGTMHRNIKTLSVKDDFPLAVVLLTRQNHSERFPDFKKNVEKENSHCYVLSSEFHPRGYKIDESNKDDYLNKIYKDEENIENWKGLGDFFNNNFKED
jgi:hypothetical protein